LVSAPDNLAVIRILRSLSYFLARQARHLFEKLIL